MRLTEMGKIRKLRGDRGQFGLHFPEHKKHADVYIPLVDERKHAGWSV